MDTHPASHLDDEALSAALDVPASGGDAKDASVAAHLAGCAQCARRREQLAAARAALAGAPVESLDELTRRRLVTRALADSAPAGAPGRPAWHRRPALAGAAAAAILAVLVAVPFLTREDRPSQTLSSAADAARESAATFLGDLGDVSSAEAIRVRLGTAGGTVAAAMPADSAEAESKAVGDMPDSATGSPSAGDTSSPPAPAASPNRLFETPAAPAAPTPAPYSQGGGAEAARPRDLAPQSRRLPDHAVTSECTSALATSVARGDRLVATGVGTFQSTPVVVSVFATPSGEVAYVTARDGCRVLERYSL